LNIIHITPLYSPSLGGTEVHTRELSIELARLGHKVSIFTTDAVYLNDLFPKIGYRTRHLGEAIFKDSGVIVYRFHVTNSLTLSFIVKCLSAVSMGMKGLGLFPQDLFDYVEAMRSSPVVPKIYFMLINSNNVDIVNSTPFPLGWSLFINDICKKRRIPFVITPRTHTTSWIYSQSFLIKTARESDAVITLTEHEKRFLVKKGVPSDKIFVTGIGVYPEKYWTGDAYFFKANHGISQNSKIVLFIGRIDKGKGVDLLLESMQIVWKRLSGVYLVLLGRSTEDTLRIKRLCQEESRVIILPDASEKTKVDALSACDVLVLPSIYESFGGVFLEAWSAGKPVIGCRIPAVKCVVSDEVDGFLVSLDVRELAERIIYLLENEDEAKRMGERGKQKVLKNYTWEIIAKKTLAVYESISKK
jgi:glycosyltransferase involved in cell wall biosynthesis